MTDPIAIVTGGSRGIGAAAAIGLAEDGYDVAITYLGEAERAAEVVRSIEGKGRRGLAVQADCGIEGDILRLFETVDDDLGTLDLLVANAGITGRFCRVDETDFELLRKVMDVNVIGVFICNREAVKRMSGAHGGTGGVIVNISSIAAGLGSPGECVHYAASKGAVESLTLGLAKEVAREGVRVCCVAPGLTETEIHARQSRPDRTERIGPNIPLGRAAEPTEIAAAIRWLAQPEASYAVATILPVTGGR